jgi:hypothetical protein
MKNTIEIFTAGCPVCDPVVQMVKDFACHNCEITTYDLVEQCEEITCRNKIQEYSINQVPSIVVNGLLLDCCKRSITKEDLVRAGVGEKQN